MPPKKKRKSHRDERIAEAQQLIADGPRFMTRAEVCAITSLTYPAIWKKMQKDEFPRSREICPGRVGWLSTEITDWLNNRPQRVLKGDKR
jgi:predicted DNA-binding transcriptional regulator AlpA